MSNFVKLDISMGKNGDPGGNRTRDNLIKSHTIMATKAAVILALISFQINKNIAIFRHILNAQEILRLNPAKVEAL